MTLAKTPSSATASDWVMRFLCGVSPGGHILDVACGRGRHMRAALAAGYRVTGVDRDLSGVADLACKKRVVLTETDLERGNKPPFAGTQYDGVIVTNYLWRPILPDIVSVVAADGVLIYETFGAGNEGYGKPSNPEFLLRPGELIDAIGTDLTPIAYEHVTLSGPRFRVVQRICAIGEKHRWLKNPPEPV